MRKMVLLAAILVAVAMGSQVVQARDRGAGVQHLSVPAGVKLHRPQHGFAHHRRGLSAKPRHFGNFGQQRFVFRFGDHGGRTSTSDPMLRFKTDNFREQVLELRRPWRFAPQRPRGFGFDRQQVPVWDRQVGVWDRQVGVWDRQAGVWDRQAGVWDRQAGVWDRQAGVWDRQVGVWRVQKAGR